MGKIYALYKFFVPLKNDMIMIKRSYDRSIEAFFEMFRFLVNFNILTALGFGYILLMHLLDYQGQLTDFCATYFPCFLQYSRFSTDSQERYAFALALFVFIGTILCIYKLVAVDYRAKKIRYFIKDDNYFSREFFNSWDFRTKRMSDTKHSVEGTKNILDIMLYEEKKKEIVKQRDSSDKCRIYTIRISLMILSIFILILGWIAIILASFFEKDITDYAETVPLLDNFSRYVSAIVLTLANYIIPKCLGWITECEKWDFAIDQIRQEIWRNYLAQMLNFGIFVIIHIELVIKKPIVRDETLIDFAEQNSKKTLYDCREDFVAISIARLLIVEIIQRYLYYFGWIIYYRIKAKCQNLNNWRKEFETTDEVVWLIYFQSIIWVSFIYYPYIAILSPIFLYLHFKFIVYRLRSWKISPQMVTNKVTSGNYIMLFLAVTFI